MLPTTDAVFPCRRRVCALALTFALAALPAAACRTAGSGGAPSQGPDTTAAVEIGSPAPGAGQTAAAPGAGQTPAAEESATEPLPPASTAAAVATQRMAELLPTLAFTFGSPGIEAGQIYLPFDVAVDPDGNIYVSDSKGVQKFGPDGSFVHRVGGPELAVAQGIAVGDDGKLYVTGLGAQVHVYDADGAPVGVIGQSGGAPGQLMEPVDAALDAAGHLYVADASNGRVEKFGPDGTHLLTIGEKGTRKGQFTSPRAVAVDASGFIYVGVGDDFLIQRFSAQGDYVDALGKSYAEETMWRVGGLAIDEAGLLYASRSIGHSIQCFDTSAKAFRWELGRLGAGPAQFNRPTGLDVRAGRLYVADTANNRIQVLELRRPAE